MTPRPLSLRPESTREALLDVAERRFADLGYDGVGVRQLAAEAGCNVAGIQYHFGSKRELYLETVRRAMERHGSGQTWAILDEDRGTRRAAAAQLVRFVRSLLDDLCAEPEGNACLRLMLREAMCPSEAIDAVVSRFTRPHQDALLEVVARIAPDLDRRGSELAVHSLFGQVLHYAIQRAFLARQSSLDPGEPGPRAWIARHVAEFTLRGLGCSGAFVQRAVQELAPGEPTNGARPGGAARGKTMP